MWNGNTHWTAAQLLPEAAHAIHDDPDVITANSTRPSGQAHVVDGGYRLTGRWSLAASSRHGWSCGRSSMKTASRAQHRRAAPEIRFMLLPASQCEIIDTWTVGGLRGTGSHDVAVHDVFVPIAFASGFFDDYVLSEPRYRIPAFCRVIPGLGAMALGIACTAIETLKEIAGAKTGAHDADAARYAGRTDPSVMDLLHRSVRFRTATSQGPVDALPPALL